MSTNDHWMKQNMKRVQFALAESDPGLKPPLVPIDEKTEALMEETPEATTAEDNTLLPLLSPGHPYPLFVPIDSVDLSTDAVDQLGRGTYGQVVVARWRNAKVACKQIQIGEGGGGGGGAKNQTHVLREDADLQRELTALAALRHPNLVQLIGVGLSTSTSTSARHRRRLLLLTELMPCSLFDLLETRGYILSLHEILDVTRDVAAALAYLHANNVLHGAVTGRNILLHGNTAKLSDAGITSLFLPTSSSSSSSSSAINHHHLAPEVSTETFRAQASRLDDAEKHKQDLYSLGVLLVQMASSETPTECREQQLKKAVKKHRILEGLLSALTSFLPSERPSAQETLKELEEIMVNDRWYPPSRRLLPESVDAGVWTRRWSEQQVEMASAVLSKKIHNSYALLQAEGRRWQQQTKRADSAEASVEQLTGQLEYVSDALESMTSRNQQLEEELQALTESSERQAATAERQAATAQSDKSRLADMLRGLEHIVHDISQRLAIADEVAIPDLQTRLKQRDDALVQSRTAERQSATARRELQRQLDEQLSETQELEVRLEQSLTRWKLEQETTNKTRSDFVKMRTTCSTLVTDKKRLEAELSSTRSRLRELEESQMPETIQRQVAELQQELSRSAEAGQVLVDKNNDLELKVADLEQQFGVLTERTERDLEQAERMEKQAARRDAAIEALRAELKEVRAAWDKDRDEASDRETLMRLQLEDMARTGRVVIIGAGGGGGEMVAEAENGEIVNGEGGAEGEAGTAGVGPETNVAASAAAAADASARLTKNLIPITGASDLSANHGQPQASLQLQLQVRRDADKAAKILVKHTAEAGGALGLARLFIDKVADQDVVWRSARALRPLVTPENNSQLCLLGVDLAAVEALSKHLNATMPQSQVMQLLGALAYGSDLCRRRAGERGALAGIVAALNTLTDDETAVLHGLTAVTNLSHNSQDNRHRFLEAKGMAALTNAAEQHINSVKVQRQACWAILTLAGSDETGRLVAQAGGGTTCVKAMLQHKNESGVQQFGLWALCNMALAGGDVTRRLRKGGALEVCRIAIETHASDAEVIRQARQAMAALGPAPQYLKGNAKVG